MLVEEVEKTIIENELITKSDKVVVGVSGGPDSICLLHVLNGLKDKIGFEFFVAHINHMIREVADEETEYVIDFCKKLGIECFVKRIDVEAKAREEKKGTEEKGREIRYEFFQEVLEKTGSNKIATAHNKNDKVETILLNIIRGSGISGLKGIEPKRDNKYIRPLIDIERKDIEKYCLENNLNPKYDESNNETIYNRNKIRNDLIPYIKKEFNPNIIKTIDRLSIVATEESEYLEKITEETYNSLVVLNIDDLPENSIAIDLKKFNNLELVIKRRVILYTINKVLGSTVNIEKVNIDDIIKLCKNNIGNKFLMPTKNIKILVKNKKIFFIPKI